MSESAIEVLQQQLAILQAKSTTYTPPVKQPPDIQSLVAAEVKRQLAELTPPEKAQNPLLGLLSRVLDEEDQKWLQVPEVLNHLPAFLSSADGQETLQIFLNEFRGYYENQTRSHSS